MRGKAAVGALVVTLALVGAAGARACSCAPQAPAESLREADGAISGRLVRVIPRGQTRAIYRYRVLRVYKGQGKLRRGRMVDVHSARRSASCALPRRIRRNYGLFLLRRHGHWFGGICGVVSPKRLAHAARARAGSSRASVAPPLCG